MWAIATYREPTSWNVVDSDLCIAEHLTQAVLSGGSDPGLNGELDSMVPERGEPVTTHAERRWRVTSDLVLAFFAEHLDGVASPLLAGDTSAHPEVTFGPP